MKMGVDFNKRLFPVKRQYVPSRPLWWILLMIIAIFLMRRYLAKMGAKPGG